MHTFAVCEVSGGSSYYVIILQTVELKIISFYMVARDNFKQSRIQYPVYLQQMINSFGLHTVQ